MLKILADVRTAVRNRALPRLTKEADDLFAHGATLVRNFQADTAQGRFLSVRLCLPDGTDVTFHAPMRLGDRVSSSWVLRGVTPKVLSIGAGGFLDFEATYTNQDDEVIAVDRTTCFRYHPAASDD